MRQLRFVRVLLSLIVVFTLLSGPVGAPAPARAQTGPASVTVPGSFQSELGCPGDWQADCAATHLAYDANDDVWQAVFNVPAIVPLTPWEYKAALNDAWTENYGAGGVQNGPNILLDIAAARDVKFYYDHKSHWITDNVNSVIVTAPGSFQSELGCSGDWDPGCLRSWLQDLDGDGVYTYTALGLPAGNYEGKAAINESWTENYGAGGVPDGPNIAFSVQAGQAVTFQYTAATHVLTITPEGGLEPGDELLVRPALKHPFEDQLLYFLMPDRFSDGTPANNCGYYTSACSPNDTEANVLTHGYMPSDKGYYHGGDINGLRAKLDYLKDMGVTALWVGPIYKNKVVQIDSTDLYGHSSGYHGYWIEDFLSVDPHLGTDAEFQSLVSEAHALGIKVFMDIITNHTADVIELQGNAGYRNRTDFPYKDAAGQAFDDAALAYYGQSNYSFPPIDPSVSFPYVPGVPAAEATVKNPAWLNDPQYYHNRGNTNFTGENSKWGDFFGLDDLWTERKEVVDGMVDIYKYWIENYGIDGYRIDTTKHVNIEFWQKFGPDILAAAQAKGISDFFAFGEVYDQAIGSAYMSEFSTRGRLQSTIDFGFQMAARDFASKSASTDALKAFFEGDDYYTDADSNAYIQPTFLGNHDMGRIGYFLKQDQTAAGDAELLARSKLAHALMYFSRGTPVIYYGDEQGFTGDGGDKDARQDMFPSLVPSYNDDDLIGTDKTTADDNFDPTHPIYQALKSYAAVRAAHPALRSGAQIQRYSSSGAGVYAHSRIDRDEKIEYIVALNSASTPASANVPTYYGAGQVFSLIASTDGAPPATLTTIAGGDLPITLPGLSFAIYKAGEAVPALSEAPGVSITAPLNNQQVTLQQEYIEGHLITPRIEVAAALTGAGLAEITFAVSVNGGAYTPIGTDTNPPYRVYYDATSAPAGATLNFKAIVSDLSGHLNGAKVTGVQPTIVPPVTPGSAEGYAIVHYNRPAGDYGDHTTGNYTDFWGLHAWGDIQGTVDWSAPIPFAGEDEYGRFAWLKLAAPAQNIGVIIHKGDIKDGTDADRFFNPSAHREIWLKADDATIYTSQAAAQGFATIHYRRGDGAYTGWGLHLWGDAIAPGAGTDWSAPRPFDGVDDFGAYWNVPLADQTKALNFIIHNGDNKDPGPDQSFIPVDDASVWVMSGDTTLYPQRGAALGVATLHYRRPAGDYGDYTSANYNDFWGLHTWGDAPDPGWTTPRKPGRADVFGQVFDVPLNSGAAQIGYILHRGDTKDPGSDQFLQFDKWGYEVWQLQGADVNAPYILPILQAGGPNPGNLGEARAYWVTEDTIAWKAGETAANSFKLCYAPDGGLQATDSGVTGGTCLPLALDPAGLPAAVLEKFPHLSGLPALKLAAADLALVPEILKGQLAVSALTPAGVSADATGLQIPGVLDDLFTYDGPLGVSWENGAPVIRLWAPTAKAVSLRLNDGAYPGALGQSVLMSVDPASGVWSVTGAPSWKGKYYRFVVQVYAPSTGKVETNTVTDPYSLNLSLNSEMSQIVDLRDAALKPSGWDALKKPALAAPEDISIYELHVRDFSAYDTSLPAGVRGTFKAFANGGSQGMRHLRALRTAGLTHVHLLPVFDFATVDEFKPNWQSPDPSLLASFAPDSEQQQSMVMSTAEQDAFNWGYDPLHYTVPEGSYSTNPNGTARIFEFRQMVQALNRNGLRVVMDVVYNHTHASGQDSKSILDRIVPGYYHRLDDQGAVTTSTCCSNTATEHNMMEKLMVDSVVTWATQYKVDGFRFDLMGHHMVRNMEKVRSALDALTPAKDGVDGKSIYIYGEGWNFGEVADNARGENATQLNLAGTGIGTFNDRARDAVRGIGPFETGANLLKYQGFANGLYYDPKPETQGTPEEQLAKLLLQSDQIRVGMAGNLASYTFTDRFGHQVTGAEVDYNGAPTGYTLDPQEDISYVEAHDNQTLFDINILAAPQSTSLADRVRMQMIGLSTVLLGQGVPFIHAGSEMLRSKSLDRNSFNSGDWFNALDFTLRRNGFGIGLPPQSSSGSDWDVAQPRLADPNLKPGQAEISLAERWFRELLKIRYSSKLFRLQTAEEIQQRVEFLNTGPDQLPGLIVMSVSDTVNPDLDPMNERVVVLINANDQPQTFTATQFIGQRLTLHGIQRKSVDPATRRALFNRVTGTFYIPARTTVVFVELQKR